MSRLRFCTITAVAVLSFTKSGQEDLESVLPSIMPETLPPGFRRAVSAAPNCFWDIVCSMWIRNFMAARGHYKDLASIR